MVKRIPCPRCGGDKTLKLHGAFTVCETLQTQRYRCANCGTLFIAQWECIGVRVYEPRPIKVLLEAGA